MLGFSLFIFTPQQSSFSCLLSMQLVKLMHIWIVSPLGCYQMDLTSWRGGAVEMIMMMMLIWRGWVLEKHLPLLSRDGWVMRWRGDLSSPFSSTTDKRRPTMPDWNLDFTLSFILILIHLSISKRCFCFWNLEMIPAQQALTAWFFKHWGIP